MTFSYKKIFYATAFSTLLAGSAFADAVTVVSWGGSYGKAQDAALFTDASKDSGIAINRESGASMSKVMLQVESGAVIWDLVVTGSGGAANAAKNGALEKIDFNVVDVSNFLDNTYTDHCIGSDVFATVAAWNTEKYGEPGTPGAPNSWADFWNVEKYPGTRSLRLNNVDGVLEPAVMAMGVPMNEVYDFLSSEGGIDKAIDKIRELKPHISVYWKSGAMQAQLMKDEEVDFITGWNGRFDVAKQDGAKVAYDWKTGIMDWEGYGIPKGAKQKDLAMKYIAEMMKPNYMAEFAKYITYGPTNKKVYELGLMEDARARQMPSHPDNAKHQLTLKTAWYAKWRTIAAEMYTEMMTE